MHTSDSLKRNLYRNELLFDKYHCLINTPVANTYEWQRNFILFKWLYMTAACLLF